MARIRTRGFLCFRVVKGAWGGVGGGGFANVHLWSVHRPGSMKWLALLVYVATTQNRSIVFADGNKSWKYACARRSIREESVTHQKDFREAREGTLVHTE